MEKYIFIIAGVVAVIICNILYYVIKNMGDTTDYSEKNIAERFTNPRRNEYINETDPLKKEKLAIEYNEFVAKSVRNIGSVIGITMLVCNCLFLIFKH